jgi:CRP-like cAMP-binding protein
VTEEGCSPDELRTLFLFEKLTDAQLDWVGQHGRVEVIPAGPVYTEGEPATHFYVLLDGTVVLSRRVGGDDIEAGRTSQRGVYAGAWQAYLGDRVMQRYPSSMRVTEPSRFFILDADVFSQLMNEWFPLPVHLLGGGFVYGTSLRELAGQRERLLALGSLSAGLTHELNNPAAAAVRATGTLRERIAGMRQQLGTIAAGRHDRESLEALIQLQDQTAERAPKAQPLAPLEASDREDAITDWLDSHGLGEGWQLAPAFVAAGLDVAWLERVAATVGTGTLEAALRWLSCTAETELLMNEIEDAATRISALVGATKPGRGSRRRSGTGSSSRSSSPNRWARAPGSVSTSPGASWWGTTGTSRWSRSPATPGSGSGCRLPRRTPITPVAEIPTERTRRRGRPADVRRRGSRGC